MIFKPELVQAIKDGRKTVTRRKIRPDEYVCRYQPDKDYAVQPGRGQHAVCRIRVTSVGREQLADITEGQARLEGFETRAEFAGYWLRLHDRHLGPHVHKLDPDNIVPHFEKRHGHTPVWVIGFELVVYDRHQPRDDEPTLLAPAARPAGSTHGYTADPFRAMPDEPEAVPPEEVEALPSTLEARQRWARTRLDAELAREDMPLTERIEHALADARAAGVSTEHYEEGIRRRVRSLENRTKRRAA